MSTKLGHKGSGQKLPDRIYIARCFAIHSLAVFHRETFSTAFLHVPAAYSPIDISCIVPLQETRIEGPGKKLYHVP